MIERNRVIRTVAAVLCTLLVLSISSTAVAANATGKGLSKTDGYISAEGVNLRKGASESFSVIAKLKRNTSVRVLSLVGSWCYVQTASQKGYVYAKYVNYNQEVEKLNTVGTVKVSSAVIRKGAGTGYRIVATVKKNVKLQVTSREGDWLSVTYGKYKGYVYAAYVQLESGSKPAGNSYPVLRMGTKGSAVTLLQQLLKDKGYYKSSVNGSFGAATRTAVMVMQERNQLKVDGVCGEFTWKKLQSSDCLKAETASDKNAAPTATPTATATAQNVRKNGKVELIDWFGDAENVVKKGSSFTIVDVETQNRYKVKRMSGPINRYHADVEPLTKADTASMLESCGGSWSSARRPVWVEVNGRVLAASIMLKPHGVKSIRDNGMNGQVCLHFLGSKIHESGKIDAAHQAAVKKAFEAGNKY